MPLTQARRQALLNQEFPISGATDYIAYSTNGTSETSAVARTAIGATGWASATAANPSTKSNNASLTSAPATAIAALTHFAVFGAASGGTQKTEWEALANPRTLAVGETVTWAIGELDINLG